MVFKQLRNGHGPMGCSGSMMCTAQHDPAARAHYRRKLRALHGVATCACTRTHSSNSCVHVIHGQNAWHCGCSREHARRVAKGIGMRWDTMQPAPMRRQRQHHAAWRPGVRGGFTAAGLAAAYYFM